MRDSSARIAAVLGSVTAPGRLRRAVSEALGRLRPDDATAQLIDLAELEIPFADGSPPTGEAARTIEVIGGADAIVLATPIYRGSLTGALKNLLDLTPIPALRDTPTAIVSMGGSDHHYLGADRHLRDVLQFFGALVVPTAVYLNGRDFANGVPSDAAAGRLDAELAALIALARARRGGEPLGPPPLAAGF